jgi:hypothetical protein
LGEESIRIDELKLASARRLLAAAIRLYFRNEDELAVQVVATASFALLQEIRVSRGETADPGVTPENVADLPLLMMTHSAYIELTEDSVWPEGTVLWVYYNTVEGTKDAVQGDLREFVDSLEKLAPAQRFGFCSSWIETLKSAEPADGSSIH